jgi:hypothetical protein
VIEAGAIAWITPVQTWLERSQERDAMIPMRQMQSKDD